MIYFYIMEIWVFLGKLFIALIILISGGFLWDKGEQDRAKSLKNSAIPFYTIDGIDYYITTKEEKKEDV